MLPQILIAFGAALFALLGTTHTQASFRATCWKENTDFTSQARRSLFYLVAICSTSRPGVFIYPREVRVRSDLPQFSPLRLTKGGKELVTSP